MTLLLGLAVLVLALLAGLTVSRLWGLGLGLAAAAAVFAVGCAAWVTLVWATWPM
jgi:hypothetical protein